MRNMVIGGIRIRDLAWGAAFLCLLAALGASTNACNGKPAPQPTQEVATLQALVASLEKDLESAAKQTREAEARADACEAKAR